MAPCVVLKCSTLNTLAADQVPNIKGKWVGKTHSIVAGVAPHWPSNRGTFEKPGMFEKDLVIEVTNQEGRRFWGIQIFSGGGETEICALYRLAAEVEQSNHSPC